MQIAFSHKHYMNVNKNRRSLSVHITRRCQYNFIVVVSKTSLNAAVTFLSQSLRYHVASETIFCFAERCHVLRELLCTPLSSCCHDSFADIYECPFRQPGGVLRRMRLPRRDRRFSSVVVTLRSIRHAGLSGC